MGAATPQRTVRAARSIPRFCAPEGTGASRLVKRRQTRFICHRPEDDDDSDEDQDQEEAAQVRSCNVSDSKTDTDEHPPAVQRTTSVATVQRTTSVATVQRTASAKGSGAVKTLARRPTGFVRMSDLPGSGFDSESEADEDKDPAATQPVVQQGVRGAGKKDCAAGTDSQGSSIYSKGLVQSQGDDTDNSEDEAGPTPETFSTAETVSSLDTDEDRRVPVYVMRESQHMRQAERNHQMELLGHEVDNLQQQVESAQQAMNGATAGTKAEPACSVATKPHRTPETRNSAILIRGQSQSRVVCQPMAHPSRARRESIFTS